MAKQTFLLPKLLSRDLAICRIDEALQDLPIEEGWRVEIHAHKVTRSEKQNNTLWWIYGQIIDLGGNMLGGWTKDDLHEYCLGEKHGWERHSAFGRTKLKPVRRSSRLSKTEFAEFVEWIYAHFEDKGFILARPDPDHALHEEQHEPLAKAG